MLRSVVHHAKVRKAGGAVANRVIRIQIELDVVLGFRVRHEPVETISRISGLNG